MSDDEFKNFDREDLILLIECQKERIGELLANKDTPQTDYPCNTCANKGDHDGECRNCVVDSEPIRLKTPSHYKPKQTDCPRE